MVRRKMERRYRSRLREKGRRRKWNDGWASFLSEKTGLDMEPGMNSLDAERNHRSTNMYEDMPLAVVIPNLYSSRGLMEDDNTVIRPASDRGSFFMRWRASVHSSIRRGGST